MTYLLIIVALCLFVLWYLLRFCWFLCRSLWRGFRFLWRLKQAKFTPRKRWALILALPMVNTIDGCRKSFLDATVDCVSESNRSFLRTPLLHQLGYRVDIDDDDVRRRLARMLESQWFRVDLHSLSPSDDPRAALAFACVRMAFLVRIAMLMNWVDDQPAWRVLLLNAQRAQECFENWEDFGRAFIAGRKQWVGALRADPLGKTLSEEDLRQLLKPSGAWARLPWPGLALLQGP